VRLNTAVAIIHNTTMSPTKLELLAGWLPGQEWFTGSVAHLQRAGGFRLDDPDGAVGIEFMVVLGDEPFLVPMTYRAAPLDGADSALIGTSQHGVLGDRWIYDGPHDPVLRAQLCALLCGAVVAQSQTTSETPDPSVLVRTADGVTDVELRRRLTADEDPPEDLAYIAAPWRSGDGSTVRGIFATSRSAS
jgi:hypothetical protein